MTTTQFNALTQMIAALSTRVEEITENQKNFATKEDLRETLKQYATKQDLAEMTQTILKAVSEPYSEHQKQLDNHEVRLNELQKKTTKLVRRAAT